MDRGCGLGMLTGILERSAGNAIATERRTVSDKATCQTGSNARRRLSNWHSQLANGRSGVPMNRLA